MKFTLKWLKEYLETEATACDICDKLDSIGLEVDGIENDGEKLKEFSCVSVESAEKHPDSDHLQVCRVKKEDGELLQIVCGAPNARKGMKAVLAPIGSTIPNGEFKIIKSKIRGVESCGMLCSEKELGLGENHDGIIELDAATPLGKNIAEIKGLDDMTIEISLTPNRGDCLGVYGIARDLSATGIGKLRELKDYKIEAKSPTDLRAEIQDENCPEFIFRHIKGVNNGESPAWIREKLKAVGINPKSALVDITNYVMLVLNRPLHCYDADKISGNIVIKKSKGGEEFFALDKNKYRLPKDATLICDTGNHILGLGGIMGGNDSASSNGTKNIVLECAVFEPISIAKTARALNINSDAKFRYERGIDREMSEMALDYATHLILDICGGKSSEIVKANPCANVDVCKFNAKKIIEFNIDSVELILGLKIERQKIIDILKNLGYGIKENTKNLSLLTLEVPSWRSYIIVKEDVIDDIIRIHNYDNLKEIKIGSEKVNESQHNIDSKLFHEKLKNATLLLAANGMVEVISWSFMNENLAAEFSSINDKLRLQNAVNTELSYMRPSILPNLMTIAKNNQDRSIENVSLFEKGKIFIDQTPSGQREMISGIRVGLTCEKDVFGASRPYDIYDVKKDLFDVLKLFGISGESLTITNDVPDYYHPDRSGALKIGNTYLGAFGEIHPLKTNKIGIKNRVNAFELYLDALPKIKEQKVTQKKKFVLNDLQPIHRDFAFLVNSDVEVGKIIDAVKKTNRELIKDVHIFDIYAGKNMEEGKKSLAFSVKIQPVGKSLTGDEIDSISDKIVEEIGKKFGGVLRDK